MIVTFDLPDKLIRKLGIDQRRSGVTRSVVLRRIIAEYYEKKKAEKTKAA